MPNQFIVPQFIDVEDKILGPISVRQFILFLAGTGLIVVDYQVLVKLANQTTLFAVSGFGILILTILFSFVKVNGRPFHIFLLNILQTVKDPRMRIWNNVVNERLQYRTEPPPPAPIPIKAPLQQTTLAKLALLVDTAGAFHEDEESPLWGPDLPAKPSSPNPPPHGREK